MSVQRENKDCKIYSCKVTCPSKLPNKKKESKIVKCFFNLVTAEKAKTQMILSLKENKILMNNLLSNFIRITFF